MLLGTATSYVCLNNFSYPIPALVAGQRIRDLAIGDLKGSGKDDIVVVYDNGTMVSPHGPCHVLHGLPPPLPPSRPCPHPAA